MKFLIVFLLVALSFGDARKLLDNIKTLSAPPTALVGINVTWTFTSATNTTNVVMVVLRLGAGEWAAVGLGQNVAMGEAHVFMCKRLANDTVVINRYVNPGSPADHTPPAHAGTEDGGLFTPLPSQFLDGVVTCQFTLSNFTSQPFEKSNALDPLSQSRGYHPIFAVSFLDANNEPKQHDGLSHEPRLNTVRLNQNENILYRILNLHKND